MGYLTAMRTSYGRRTRDGAMAIPHRHLVGWRLVWYRVPAEQEARIRRRMDVTTLAVGAVIVALAAFQAQRPWIWAAFLVVPIVLDRWRVSGLSPLAPEEALSFQGTDEERALEFAQSMGRGWLLTLLVASVVMGLGQIAVVVVDGAWWAYVGTVLFASAGFSMWRSLRLLGRAGG